MDLRARRAALLAHRHRLDHGAVGDRRHPRQRRHAGALRRCARLPRTRPALGHRRAPPGEHPRRLAHADPRADGQRRRSGACARPVVAAHPRLDRRAVERRSVALVLRRGRQRSVPDHEHLGRHGSGGVLPVPARGRADVAVLARRARARHGGRRVRRRRPSGARRGRRVGVHQAVAGHDAGVVPRSRALPRNVLVSLARRVVARRFRERRPPTANGFCTVVPTTRSSSRASASARPRSRRSWSRTRRCSRRPRSASPTN